MKKTEDFSLTLFVDYKTGNPIDIEWHEWKGMDENAKIYWVSCRPIISVTFWGSFPLFFLIY